MRLRSWIAVVVSVILLMAVGTIGILVNRSALRAADTVHRADSRALGLPAPTDPGFAPLRELLASGRPGFSSTMMVGTVPLEAVAVPVVVGGAPVAILVGFNEVAKTQLQAYVAKLSDKTHFTTGDGSFAYSGLGCSTRFCRYRASPRVSKRRICVSR